MADLVMETHKIPVDLLEYFEPVDLAQNKSVFVLNPGSYKGAHFATFPPALVEPMIKAGTSAKGCCPECGAPWERVTTKEIKPPPDRINNNSFKHDGMTTHGEGAATLRNIVENTTTGWTPTCTCNAGPPVPCTVLDPFAGTFTTGEVAIRLGRRAVGIELSQEYCDEHIIPRLEAPVQLEMLV